MSTIFVYISLWLTCFVYYYLLFRIVKEYQAKEILTKRRYWCALFFYLLLVALWVVFEPESIFSIRNTIDVSWRNSDQAGMFNTLNDFRKSGELKSRFPLGVFGVIAPFEYLFNPSNSFSLNWKMLPLHVFLILPLGFLGLGRLCSWSAENRGTSLIWIIFGFLSLAYCLFPPEFILERYAHLSSRRTLFLVFGPELYSYPLVIYCWYVLYFRRSILNNIHTMGLISAVLLMFTERNIPFVCAIALGVLAVQWRLILKYALWLFVGLLPLLVHQVSTFGAIFASRSSYWKSANRAEVWKPLAMELYSVELSYPLKQMSLEYGYDNLLRFSQWWYFWLVFAVLSISLALFFKFRKTAVLAAEQLAVFGVMLFHVLLCLFYINPSVNFRYFAATLPIVSIFVCRFLSMVLIKKTTKRLF